MKTGKKIALLIGILLLAFGLTVLQIAHHRGESFRIMPTVISSGSKGALSYNQKGYTVLSDGEASFSAAEVEKLRVDWVSGSVSVERWNGKELVVREKAPAKLAEDERARWKLSDGTLSILPCADQVRNLPEKELTVLVPQSLMLEGLDVDVASASVRVAGLDAKGKLSLDSASGSLQLEDCRCGSLRVESASGSQRVLCCAVSGDANMDAASGSITAEEFSCDELSLDTASGSQQISALECRALSLSAASGSIEAEELLCGRVKVDGGSGAVRLGFASAPEQVNVDTASGAVTLSFPRGTGLDLDFDTASGKLRGEVVYGELPVDVDTASGNLTIEYR